MAYYIDFLKNFWYNIYKIKENNIYMISKEVKQHNGQMYNNLYTSNASLLN